MALGDRPVLFIQRHHLPNASDLLIDRWIPGILPHSCHTHRATTVLSPPFQPQGLSYVLDHR
ncbi:hypothetical protein AURDEDRAFT_178409 [Auricularia subglabra TFB-10046 SS5]|uniref:Uncharacterized protein n=1 Tax=Auricularia subglabra (strain TFB-10046 / SS5) TaxID=717982 RepID=J0D1Q5_AURST|nr:hypothetical protein AURDEDRAFT_178409 [Auricularia subglabra TFB-10046 SS5]